MAIELNCSKCSMQLSVEYDSTQSVSCPTCGSVLQIYSSDFNHCPTIDSPKDVFTPPDQDETRTVVPVLCKSRFEFGELPVRVGRFLIESWIENGGFSSVYRAYDEHLERTVAIKVPRLEKFQDRDRLQDFVSEAKIAAKLHHPGIVTIYDVGEFEGQLPFISMEYIDGPSLSKLMKTTRPDLKKSVDLMIQIAEAVHAAIKQGVVHRDLKPSNVLIDTSGVPRVVDFGLAVTEEGQTLLRGEVAGTPPYMSPEQFRGESHQLDARTDVWSMGVIFYELLAGRRPFRGNPEQLRDEVFYRSPKPVRQIDDSIPKELEAICLKCLEKSPADRYFTAKDFAEALSDWKHNSTSTSTATSKLGLVYEDIAKPKTKASKVGPYIRPSLTTISIVSLLVIASLGLVTPPRKPNKLQEFSVDSRAITHEWVPVLDAAPVPLCWDTTNPNSVWAHAPELRRLTVSSSSPTVFALGETKSQAFRFQINIGKASWSGSAGLFIGGLPVRSDSGQDGFQYECISVETVMTKGNIIYKLERGISDIYHTRNSVFASTVSRQLHVIRVPQPYAETILEVRVNNGMINSVLYNGAVVPELTPQPLNGIRLLKDRPALLGVHNSQGSSTFRDVRYMTIEKTKNDE